MDPQQRLLLECTAEVLAAAGAPSGGARDVLTGTFVGASSTDYNKLALR